MGRGQFIWIQTASLGKHRRTRKSGEVVKTPLLWSQDSKPFSGAEIQVLQEKPPDLPGDLDVSEEWICGKGRQNGGENIQRISINNPSTDNVNQKGVVLEKVGAKERDGDWNKLERPEK